MEHLLIGMRFVQFAAVMILCGSSLFPLYAVRRFKNQDQVHAHAVSFVARTARITAVAALLSAVGWLACEASLMSGDPSGYLHGTTLLTLLTQTQFGRIWSWRLIWLTAFCLFVFFLRHRQSSAILWPAIVSGVFLVGSLAGVGHGAMGVGSSVWIHLGNQSIHLLSASVWVGGLFPLLHLIHFTRRNGSSLAVLTHALKQFSNVGMVAVLFILFSGCVNSWFLVGSIHALLHSVYGKVLVVKIMLFMFMICLALLNRCVVMPRLNGFTDSREVLSLLSISVTAEQFFAICVVAAVSVLGTLAPPFDMIGMGM